MAAAFGVGLSLAVLPAGPAGAAGGTHVRCNDITGLKNAINRANTSGPNTSGGRITLASHCTYTLTAPDHADDGLPEITGDVTITGRDTTIRRNPEATQDFRIFHVVLGGNLTLNSLTISGGSLCCASGGGIYNDRGTVNLNRTVIKRNHTLAGGGVLNDDGARLNIDHSTVEGNVARSWGGGIANANGTMTMKGGALLRNRAGFGGGLANNSSTASLDSVSVRGNTAQQGGGIDQIRIFGAPVGSTLRLTSTTVRDNIAVTGAGLSTQEGTATLVRSLVTHNTAITAGGGIFVRSPRGAAVSGSAGEVTLRDSKVVRNRPDNCNPEGSVPGCTNPTQRIAPPTSQLSPTRQGLPRNTAKTP
ncbi:hypothetical protein G4Z16_24600 [Streptomyces bathyalis]|uniref:Right handed beta helix domain-containing protein n=1 Tax=Streptomyces bathyalis TaxID=2710756 RepID=A0A7T1T9Y6_9ACTN|nr:hypothetical protein [Streptomyces bathyalis]QPP09064.1 hypothetical protein G4Z16_24600 [Streptomyces bathyalis]